MTAFQFGPKKKEKNSLKKRGTATPADKKKTRYKLGNEKKKNKAAAGTTDEPTTPPGHQLSANKTSQGPDITSRATGWRSSTAGKQKSPSASTTSASDAGDADPSSDPKTHTRARRDAHLHVGRVLAQRFSFDNVNRRRVASKVKCRAFFFIFHRFFVYFIFFFCLVRLLVQPTSARVMQEQSDRDSREKETERERERRRKIDDGQ